MFVRRRGLRGSGSPIFRCLGLSFEFAPALLFFLLLLREFSLSLLKLVIGSCQNGPFPSSFPTPPREALCRQGPSAIRVLSDRDGFVLVAIFRPEAFLTSHAFAHRDPFAVGYRIEIARADRFPAEELLLFKRGAPGLRTCRILA